MPSKEELVHRLELLGISGAEVARLRALRPLLERTSSVLVVDFYRHLLSFPETRPLLRDPERRKRLLERRRSQLLNLSNTPLDDQYLEEQRRIGETDAEVGLAPGWSLGAQAQSFALLAFLIEEVVGGDVGEFRLLLVALLRRILLDIQLSVEAYVESPDRRLENEDRAGKERQLGSLRVMRSP